MDVDGLVEGDVFGRADGLWWTKKKMKTCLDAVPVIGTGAQNYVVDQTRPPQRFKLRELSQQGEGWYLERKMTPPQMPKATQTEVEV